MSSTRRQAEGGPFRQERYASSAEYERGLMANLVAMRCAVLDAPADRELIWFLQYVSHQSGGLKAFVERLIIERPEHFATEAMRTHGIKEGQTCKAALVRVLRESMQGVHDEFLLKGEHELIACLSNDEDRLNAQADRAAQARPVSYPASKFLAHCRRAASNELVTRLQELCLDPQASLAAEGPWYCPQLLAVLRESLNTWRESHAAACVVTGLGKRVGETLDYAAETARLVLIDGAARTGKTHAAQRWCEQRPGRARYVQVPSSNDEIGFLIAIARALGVSVESSPKAHKLRTRIEGTLHGRDLMLVFDEAHYCWPQSNYRHAKPVRINWIMTALVNQGVPVALVTTPQFLNSQKATETHTAWTSEQFTGRIGHYEKLPDRLDVHDLAAVASALLPEGDKRAVEMLVEYARTSQKYLAGIDAVVSRARYLAKRDARERVTTADIKLAIIASALPSDAAFSAAVKAAEAKPGRHQRRAEAVLPAPCNEDEPPLQPNRLAGSTEALGVRSRAGTPGITAEQTTG